MAYQYGCRPNRDPTRWGGAGAPSQVFCAAKSWRRGNSLAPGMSDPLGVERPQGAEPQNKTIRQRQMVLFLVRAWGLEPQRITPREPKGDVTLVKGFLFVSGNKQFVFGVVLRILVNLLLHSNHNCRQCLCFLDRHTAGSLYTKIPADIWYVRRNFL